MTLYLDSSAFAKRFFANEIHHEEALAVTDSDPAWIASRLTLIESSRALQLGLEADDLVATMRAFDEDSRDVSLIELDPLVLSVALEVALETGIKTLDAIQVASAALVSDRDLRFLTFDARQAQAAAAVGLQLAR